MQGALQSLGVSCFAALGESNWVREGVKINIFRGLAGVKAQLKISPTFFFIPSCNINIRNNRIVLWNYFDCLAMGGYFI